MDLISRDALIAGMHAWVLDKAKPLGQILVEQGALSAPARDKLEAVVELHLEVHGGDPQKSLAMVSSIGSVRQELERVADAELRASLTQVSVARQGEELWSTQPHAVGERTLPGMRFRILHKHAEGGLGAVFVAHDEELHRQVALKEIKEKYADQPQSRSRFLLEAEVTGGLEHPGIVPVYGLGCYPDGRPYYAMRFIKGDSLADAIRRFHAAEDGKRDPGERSLAFRELLGRFVDACNALAYAHARGILHRDVKPHNIMLGNYGETLVVDWGLAKVIGHQEGIAGSDEGTLRPFSGGETAPTQAGDVMGTPTYMSPEQAAGRLDLLGPASDIYSLGATVYALLTGKAPFAGSDKGELLERVQRGHWLPPRQVKPDVPAALEAICRKAMALKPEDRYPSALALAAEVEHWLADEPVAAYPEPWLARLGRWGRRHRAVVAAAAALLLTVLVALLVSSILIRQRERAAQAARQQAEAQRDRADHNLRLVRDVVDNTVTKIAGNPRLKQANFHQLRHELLEYLVPLYEDFVKQRGNDSELEVARGQAWGSLANLRNEMGEKESACSDYEQMRAIFAQLVADFPAVPQYRLELARSHQHLGILLRDLDKRADAESALHEALNIQAQLARDFPSVPQYRQDLATSHNDLGLLLRDLGKRPDAETAFREALKLQAQLAQDFPAVPEYRLELATSNNNLSLLLHDLGKRADAESASREALRLRAQLAQDFPAMPQYRQDLARSHFNLGLLLNDLGKRAEAETASREALKILAQLVQDFPAVPQYRLELAKSHNNLGKLLAALGKRAEAETASRESLKIVMQLAQDFPAVLPYRQELANSHNSLGMLLATLGKRAEAETAYREALKIRTQLAHDFPAVLQYRLELANSHNGLGVLLVELGKRADAETAFREALKIQAQLAQEFPAVPQYRQELARSQNNLGNLLRALGKRADAESAYREAVQIRAQLARDFPAVPQYRRDLATSHNSLGALLAEQSKQADAETAWREAVKLQAQLAQDFPAVPAYRNDLAVTMVNMAMLLRQSKKLEPARRLLEEALPHHQAALQADPGNVGYRQYFRANRRILAEILVDLGEHAAATATLGELPPAAVTPAGEVYKAACIFARCVPLAERDSRLSEDQRKKRAQAYADRALATLRQAVQNGYRDTAHIKKDPDLDPLRSHPEFQKLLQEMEAKPE
jgi:serine/threonine-protein kinase